MSKLKFWEFAEKRAAKYYLGNLVTGSGRGYLKSDVAQKRDSEDTYRIEVKSTEKQTISFQTSWIPKIIKEAYEYKQHPALYLLFGCKTGFAIYPPIDEEIETNLDKILHINSSSTTLSPQILRNYEYLKIHLSFLKQASIPNHLHYTSFRIREDLGDSIND